MGCTSVAYFQKININYVYDEKEKAIYNYIKLKTSTLSANCTILRYKPTDNIDNPVVKSYGEWYDVYEYEGSAKNMKYFTLL